MYFVSAVNSGTKFSITLSKCVELISHYRSLSPTQIKAIDNALQEQLDPSKFDGDKPKKKDYHNWKNKADQMFKVLSQTTYFDKNTGGCLVLTQKKGFNASETRLLRSYTEKKNYFREHSVKKLLGFELHHIVALGKSKSLHEFKALDSWKNMLYIDGQKHSELSQSGNKHIYLNAVNKDLLLSRYPKETEENDFIYLSYDKNVVYNFGKQDAMIAYNKGLIQGHKS